MILASPVGHRTDGFCTTGSALHASSSLGPAALCMAAHMHSAHNVNKLGTVSLCVCMGQSNELICDILVCRSSRACEMTHPHPLHPHPEVCHWLHSINLLSF